jgi:hypothetical protein
MPLLEREVAFFISIRRPVMNLNDLWQPIETAAGFTENTPSVLVYNGERVGEAELREDYTDYEYDGDVPLRWAWTHHSTCSCCHSFMNPQPIAWQPMPDPPSNLGASS